MRLKDVQVPFFVVIAIQLLTFIFIIMRGVLEFTNMFHQLPFFVLEILVFLPLIFKIEKRFFYLVWEFEFFLLVFFNVIFYFEETFYIQDPSIGSIITISGLLLFLQLLVMLGFLMKEKSVKPILTILSSTSAVVVMLMVFFIFRGGLPAFHDNGPVSFITGDEWTLFHIPGRDYELDIYVENQEYDPEITLEDEQFYLNSSESVDIYFKLLNNGSKDDSFSVRAFFEEEQEYLLVNDEVELHSMEETCYNISVGNLSEGDHKIIISCESINGHSSAEDELTLVVGNLGIDLYPDYRYQLIDPGEEYPIFPILINNTGDVAMTYKISLDFDHDWFTPSVGGDEIEWDYTTYTTEIFLEPGEEILGGLNPRPNESMAGHKLIYVIIESVEEPSIRDVSVFDLHYTTQKILVPEHFWRPISPGKEIVFTMEVNSNPDRNISVSVAEIEGFTVEYWNESGKIGSGWDGVDLELNSTGNNTLFLKVIMDTDYNEENKIKFDVTLHDGGTEATFGIAPFIVGTFLLTLIALIVAVPIGLLSAIYLAEYCPTTIAKVLRPMIELIAGIPSILFGLWGFLTLGPWFRKNIYFQTSDAIGNIIPIFKVPDSVDIMGGSVLLAGLILGVMILPIIITLSEDAIRSVSRGLKEGSLALGTTKWQTIHGVVLKKAKSGIISSIILATGRAIGETMAVLMILTVYTRFPESLFDKSGSMTGIIAGTMTGFYYLEESRVAAFGVAVVLYVMVFILNLIIFSGNYNIVKRFNEFIRKKINIGKNKKKLVIDKTVTMDFISSLKLNSTKKLRIFEYGIKFIQILAIILVIISLFMVLGNVLTEGITSFKLRYLIEPEGNLGRSGGFANALLGSFMLTALSLGISIPLAVGSAIYMVFYSKSNNIFNNIILFASDTLASTPSIIFGTFGFIFLLMELGFESSMLAAGLVLAMMVLPILLRSSIEALKSIPKEMANGSLALGASKWQTITKVILPPAMGGITSGIILSIGRAIGETAAIIFTAGYLLTFSESIMEPVATMPTLIYLLYKNSTIDPIIEAKVWSAAFTLIMLILFMNSIARIFQWRSNRMMKGKY